MSDDGAARRDGAWGTVFGVSDAGCARAENQDSLLVADLSGARGEALLLDTEAWEDAEAALRLEVGELGLLLMVADGMGGAAAGAYASRLAVGAVYDRMRRGWCGSADHSPRHFAGCLREAVEHANLRLHEAAAGRPELEGMGTTATVAGVLDGSLYLAHVGDSRAYLLRDGRCTQLTRDQSYVQMLVDAGQMTDAEAERSAYANVVLQALGTAERVDVDVTCQALRRGDVVLVCSDGLTRVVRGEEFAGLVDGAPIDAACAALLRLARERGAPDNVTAVLLRLDGARLEAPRPDDVVARRACLPPVA